MKTLIIVWMALRALFLPAAQEDKSAQSLNDQAVRMNNNSQEEESLYKAAIEADPKLLEPHLNLAILYLSTDRREAAVVGIERALTKIPNDPDLLYLLGLAYSSSGNFKEAADLFAAALRTRPDWADPSYNMGLLFWNPQIKGSSSDPLKAEFCWKRTLEAKPDDVRSAEALASLYAHQSKYPQAIEVLSKQDENSLSADGLHNLSLCLKKMKKKDEAKRIKALALERRKQTGPSSPPPVAAPTSPAPDQATAAMEPKVEPAPAPSEPVAPVSASPPPQTGNLYVDGLQAIKDGRFEEARTMLSQLASEKPDYRDVQWYLASCLLELGREAEALPPLQLAIQQNDKHPYAYVALGVLLEKGEKADEALRMYKKALEVAPDSLFAPTAQEGIQRLEGR